MTRVYAGILAIILLKRFNWRRDTVLQEQIGSGSEDRLQCCGRRKLIE
jgi:hypothetical protein